MSPRCGRLIKRNERTIPVLDDPVCGRKAGHPGQHRSTIALGSARWRRVNQAASGRPAVAAAIREAREAAGLSQRRLAAVLGVTDVCVGLWERAQRTPGETSWTQLELTLGPLGIVRERGPEAEAQDAATGEADAA